MERMSHHKRPLCKLCIGDNIRQYMPYRRKKISIYMPNVHCNQCTGLESFVCHECLEFLYTLPRPYEKLIDHTTIQIETETMKNLKFIIHQDLTSCFCRVMELYMKEKMVPYCTNVFHRIINTFSFQDAVKVKVVEKGFY